jgi:hypothetical protein
MPARPRRIGTAHLLGAAALFVALGGTSVAQDTVRAITGADVRNNSLTGKDVRDRSLTGSDVRDRSLTGRDVRDRSLTAADLAPGVVQSGPAGPPGPAGERGPTGPPGPDLAGATHVRVRGDRTSAENGAALRAALASITDASPTKPYVIQLAPGVYELGATTLAMKPDVSIAGAGAPTTRIVGCQGQSVLGDALVLGADRTLLRDVTIANTSDAGTTWHVAVGVRGGATMRIEDTVLDVQTTGERGWSLVVDGSGTLVDVRDSRLEADSSIFGIAVFVEGGADVRIQGSELVAGSGPTAVGVRANGSGSTAVVEHSVVTGSGDGVLTLFGGAVTVGASRVEGGAFGLVSCVGSYNGAFAALDGTCN